MKNYKDGSEIYVFGFRRGAFTARSFVQMIATCGLIWPRLLRVWGVCSAFRRYSEITCPKTGFVVDALAHGATTPL